MRVLTERMKGREVDLLDGIKIIEERGWVQVIPDANEPLVHVYAEADTEAEATRLELETRRLVEQIINAGDRERDDKPSSEG
jgi:mannose-1-phosphate guanylyltransferase/phosphomannomutase